MSLGLLLLTRTSLALAQSSQLAQDGLLKSGPPIWDSNRDGVYTCAEWKAYLDRMFTLADRNHDGHLDESEFATVRKLEYTRRLSLTKAGTICFRQCRQNG
jgi:hypothetical protein